MDELTEKQARALADSGFWEKMNDRERATFQLNTKRLCMPFPVFHAAVESALGRAVHTHEFGLNADGLRKELRGETPPPTMDEILGLIPAGARVIIAVTEDT